nr:hypothetical protein BaRGS_024343 [Batillaria attramentaria]
MNDDSKPQELKTECAVVLGSLAKGTDKNIHQLVSAGVAPVLLKALFNPNLPYVEACLRCLRTIFLSPNPPFPLVYHDAGLIPHMFSIISKTMCTKECIANILANSCLTLSTLVRMCKRDRTLEENVEGAETLSYLIEVDPELQKTAAISDHIVKCLAEYLKYTDIQQLDSRQAQKKDVDWGSALKQAAFQAFASLGANDEEIRKRAILECGAISILVDLCAKNDPALRLNGAWGLMNLAFQAEQKVKMQIIETLGSEQLFCLLSDPSSDILMRTLGLLRNLLSKKSHIDSIMTAYGTQVMQAIVFILEGDHSPLIKEQALCILGNIADGLVSKEYIMTNDDVIKKIVTYMMCSHTQLQVAAVFIVSNLLTGDDEGAYTRMARLRDMGFQRYLQQLLSHDNPDLYEKVKHALHMFS